MREKCAPVETTALTRASCHVRQCARAYTQRVHVFRPYLGSGRNAKSVVGEKVECVSIESETAVALV